MKQTLTWNDHTMTVSPVNKVGASVSFPYSSANTGIERDITAAITAAEERKCPIALFRAFKDVVDWGCFDTTGEQVRTNALIVGRAAKRIARRQVVRIMVKTSYVSLECAKLSSTYYN